MNIELIEKFAKKQNEIIDEAKERMAAHPDDDAFLMAIMVSAVDEADAAREGTGLKRHNYESLLAQRQAEEAAECVPEG